MIYHLKKTHLNLPPTLSQGIMISKKNSALSEDASTEFFQLLRPNVFIKIFSWPYPTLVNNNLNNLRFNLTLTLRMLPHIFPFIIFPHHSSITLKMGLNPHFHKFKSLSPRDTLHQFIYFIRPI